MKNRVIYALAALALAAAAGAPAWAQTTPYPSPQATMAPSPAATSAAAPTAHPAATNPGKHLGQIKKIAAGTLSVTQVAYGLTHLPQEISSLRKIHKVKFENLRVQRVPTTLRRLMRTSQLPYQTVVYEPVTLNDALAQTPAPSGLLGSLVSIFANINISDALNNALNHNTVNLSLSNVLNGNKIAIGQVVGVYVGGAGIITTLLR
jgi:hypothetical protein